MPEFNNMTLVAAAQMLDTFHSHSDLALLELEWGIQGRCSNTSKSARLADMAGIAVEENPEVSTLQGRQTLSRTLVEKALTSPSSKQTGSTWIKLVAGLRMDGFEIVEERETVEGTDLWDDPKTKTVLVLRRMLPQDLPGLDFRDAESELVFLLNKHGFGTATGHLNQAISAFSQGDWAAANAQFRSFFEGYLKEIADSFGYSGKNDHRARVRFLGEQTPPFLLPEYNEWNGDDNKPQYVHGLMSRMHPAGSHPGLSEEEDCTFRMQITLITARLFIRRFDQRKT